MCSKRGSTCSESDSVKAVATMRSTFTGSKSTKRDVDVLPKKGNLPELKISFKIDSEGYVNSFFDFKFTN